MLASVRALSDRIQRLDKQLRQLKTEQVFQTSPREGAKAIVDQYFGEVQPQLRKADVADLADVEDAMQVLLEIAQRNSMVATYRRQLKMLERLLLGVEKQVLTGGSTTRASTLEPVDLRIIETLSRLVPSAARSYQQGVTDLLQDERLSWRGPATDLRESLRETLDHLAPDTEVIAEPGYKQEKEAKGPTMKQKVRYILKKRGVGKAGWGPPESATETVDELIGTFVRGVYSHSSVSTHTPTDKKEVVRVRTFVRVALCEILEIPAGA